MWDPERFTTLWTSTACYRDRFTLLIIIIIILELSEPISTFMAYHERPDSTTRRYELGEFRFPEGM
jgi:hypothetical protein